MTTAQYLAALKRLGLSPHGIQTRGALGLSARQLARLAAGGTVTRTLELLLRMYLKYGLGAWSILNRRNFKSG